MCMALKTLLLLLATLIGCATTKPPDPVDTWQCQGAVAQARFEGMADCILGKVRKCGHCGQELKPDGGQ